MNVYVAPLPLNPLTEPFVTVTSVEINPVTDSLKVTVTGIADKLVRLVAVDVIVVVGAV